MFLNSPPTKTEKHQQKSEGIMGEERHTKRGEMDDMCRLVFLVKFTCLLRISLSDAPKM
jgi:hypothetical protein